MENNPMPAVRVEDLTVEEDYVEMDVHEMSDNEL